MIWGKSEFGAESALNLGGIDFGGARCSIYFVGGKAHVQFLGVWD